MMRLHAAAVDVERLARATSGAPTPWARVSQASTRAARARPAFRAASARPAGVSGSAEPPSAAQGLTPSMVLPSSSRMEPIRAMRARWRKLRLGRCLGSCQCWRIWSASSWVSLPVRSLPSSSALAEAVSDSARTAARSVGPRLTWPRERIM